MEQRLFTLEQEEHIRKAINRGNDIEIKLVRENLIIVEVKRKLRIKQPLISYTPSQQGGGRDQQG